jgi:dihydrofolate reductase
MASGVRVFIATSRDGFIAGPDDDLSWLPDGHAGEDYGYEAFMAGTSAIVMGRRTHDVVQGFGIDWPYGDTPVFVVTSRPLETDEPSVQAVSGTPAEILARVREVTDGGVYVDGGEVIRQFLDAGLIDEATITVIPVDISEGVPLFTHDAQRARLGEPTSTAFPSGVVQRRYSLGS